MAPAKMLWFWRKLWLSAFYHWFYIGLQKNRLTLAKSFVLNDG